MYVIVAAIFSTVTNLSMTITLPDHYDNYVDCLYWATTYKASVNDQEGPVKVREVQCRLG
jgi:hypothetical protein